ncbi:MAG TPA: SPOR domain-containing protein [Candidatus Binatia bacterium]|nr:SPOR domain-containing protein [Candidatus Binatia bacterium]
MSWRRNGLYFSFNREAISVCAPADSGVYILYNLNDPVFVGESTNIQEALLNHEHDTELRSGPHRPTGFTFETCSARKRKQKADDLIERLRPVLQTQVSLPEATPVTDDAAESEFPVDGLDPSDPDDVEEFSAHERDSRPMARRRFKSGWAQAVTLSVAFLAGVAVSFYLGTIAGAKMQARARPEVEPTFAWMPLVSPAPQVSIDLDDKGFPALDRIGEITIQIPGWTATPTEVQWAAANWDRLVPGAPQSNPGAEAADQIKHKAAENFPAVQLAGGAETTKKWSVQISAAPAKDIADALAERLTSSGYNSYVVQAHVNGQTYFRVRVGHVADHEEAESLRQSLTREQGYRDAFLVRD